jgi:TRAP-type C4-dicarboxylate transport system permease small subunit
MLAARAIGAYRKVMEVLLASVMLILLIIMCAQVFYRYVLNDSLIWAEEVCKYLLVWVSFLACGVAYDRGEIAAFDVVSQFLSRRAAAILRVVSNLCAIVLLVVLVVYGWRYAMRSGGQSIPAFEFIMEDLTGQRPEAHFKIFWIYLSIPIGMGLLALHIAVESALFAISAATGRPLPQRSTGTAA